VLPLALRIGEAEVDPFDLLFLDDLQNVGRLIRHWKAFPRENPLRRWAAALLNFMPRAA
jgi:hypothetical protein